MPLDQVNFVFPAVETDAVLRLLVDARALLAKRGKWMKYHQVADRRGNRLMDAHHPDAAKFCSFGAIRFVGPRTSIELFLRLFEHDLEQSFGMPLLAIARFNDGPDTTHADMLALFDRAIAARRAEIVSSAR